MTPPRQKPPIPPPVLRELAAIRDEAARRRFLKRRPRLFREDVVLHLSEVVRSELRADPQRALALAEAAVEIARKLASPLALALSLRSKANALYMTGDNQQALEIHREARQIFRDIGNEHEEARTLIPSIQPLILLGDYDRAEKSAQEAREILTRLGDVQRLGHLEINVGNIFHRQDRFEEALARYERAYEMLLPLRDSEGLAVALYNLAVSLISLNDFPRALASYQRARQMCLQHDMPLLVTQADYNIAYLYYLRGEYSRAIEMLRATREKSQLNGDAHLLALCYLDLSDIYLELNLAAEARDVAHEGFVRFRKLGMGYEEAKCQANEATATSQLGSPIQALELFERARAKFVAEKNLVWPSLIDLYRALVLFNEGRYFESRHLCAAAASFFDQSFLPNKAVLCHLLLSRLELQTGNASAAQSQCDIALMHLGSIEAPVLRFQAEFLAGQIREAQGNPSAAYYSYQASREALETLRSSLHGEELKISFVKDRLEVYERLVDICMNDPARSPEETFGYIELAKSRSLAEMLVRHGPVVPDSAGGQSALVRRIREMREELNWYYRRLEIEEQRADDRSHARIENLRRQALTRENELVRALREIPASPAAPGDFSFASLDGIRRSLPPDSTLVEYFTVKGLFIAAVLTPDSLEIIPLTPVSRVMSLLRLFDFQIGKFQLGGDYARNFSRPLFEAAQSHLQKLHAELIAPLRPHLRSRHLVIVPHASLHYLPFHALFDGDRYLLDSFSVSYAPSAAVFRLCQEQPSSASGPPLVLGIPDEKAPFIRDEVRAVAKILPAAELFLGPHASLEILRAKGLRSCSIHIATHGSFRRDNPMFSGIRLGDGFLSLYDLYQLRLGCDLLALSGCATGLSVVASGDELLGLIRGLLSAGARSLLLTLWNVNDSTTAQFMTSFYTHWQSGSSLPSSLQSAAAEIRQTHPHPYFWAPFTLTGKIGSA